MKKSKNRKRRQTNQSTDGPLKKVAKTTLEKQNFEGEMKKKKTKSKKRKGKKVIKKVEEKSTDIASRVEGACASNVEMMEIEKEEKAPKLKIDLTQLFSTVGSRPCGTHLHCNDIKNLLLCTVLSPGKWNRPSWCNMTNWNSVKHTLFVMVGYVSEEDYVVYKECFKNINKNFTRGYPVKNDGSEGVFVSPLETYLHYRMKRKTARRKHKDSEGKATSPEELILTKEQRIVNEYPFADDMSEDDPKVKGYVCTKTDRKTKETETVSDEKAEEKNFQMFAIDCEMCETMNGRELTRVSIVNQNLEAVYDKFVKPEVPITNYLTEFSGITPEILNDVKTKLGDVQQHILDIVSENDILIGHSLENDLRCLKVIHERIIDTSVIFGDQRGTRFKPSLKTLVKEHLRREIQNNESGHCSIEDAKACMELVQLKLEKGKHYGVLEKPNESIFEAFSRANKSSVVVDTPIIARQHCFLRTHGVICTSDDEVVRGTKSYAGKASFVFSHLRKYEQLLKVCDRSGGKPPNDKVQDTLKKLDDDLGEIIENTEKDSLLVVLFSSGFLPSRIQGLQRDKEMRKTDEVKMAVKRARDCICFVKVT